MTAKLPKGWPEDRPMAVCINIPLEWWPEGVAPGVSPFGNPLRNDVVDTAARQWAEYGLNVGIHRLADIAESFGFKFSCHASGILFEERPELMRRVHEGGHEIMAHCWTQHRLLCYMDRDEEDREMKRCAEAQEKLLGERPLGFAVPRGMLSADTEELMAANGYRFYADDMSGDMPRIKQTGAGPVVCIPYDMEVNDLAFHLRHGNRLMLLPEIVGDIMDGYPRIGSPPTVLDLGFHAHVSGRIAGSIQFLKVMEILARTPFAWVTTRTEIARLMLAEHAERQG